MDRESLALSTNPKFMSIIAKARASRGRGTISGGEMRRRLGLSEGKGVRKKAGKNAEK
jgi:hypothetical protein